MRPDFFKSRSVEPRLMAGGSHSLDTAAPVFNEPKFLKDPTDDSIAELGDASLDVLNGETPAQEARRPASGCRWRNHRVGFGRELCRRLRSGRPPAKAHLKRVKGLAVLADDQALTVCRTNYFSLEGGTIFFMRRYTEVYPYSSLP